MSPSGIPHLFHQTWYTHQLPPPIQESIDQMRALNPSFGYHLSLNDEMDDYVIRHVSKETAKAYLSISFYATRSDFWRYLTLYHQGGVYLDVDSVIHANLDDTIADGIAVVSRETNWPLFVQWCLIFPPYHPILKACIEQCEYNMIHQTSKDGAKLTGPHVLTKAVVAHMKEPHLYDLDDALINRNASHTQLKIMGWDYEGLALASHPQRHLLYEHKTHWRKSGDLFINT